MGDDNIRQKTNEILEEVNSFSARNWKSFTLMHNKEKGQEKAYKKINCETKDAVNGLYVYTNKNGCLYVGEGNLKARFKDHYKESYRNLKGKGKRWHKFFGAKENQGEITIFWKPMEKKKAKVVEQMLNYVLGPSFGKDERVN